MHAYMKVVLALTVVDADENTDAWDRGGRTRGREMLLTLVVLW